MGAERIGDYELVRLLGKGGMSEVWEAFNGRTGSRHALKLYAYAKEDPVVRNRFEQEGRMLAALNHPRVVKVTDFGTADRGRPYFVMSLVLGAEGKPQSLADVPVEMIDEESVGRWYDDVREALAFVHANGVIHRDLKLQNVLIGPDGHAVLVDFGISRVLNARDGEGGNGIGSPVDTIVQMQNGKRPVMGSVGYMAPELEMGLPATQQSDWYALGVIVYRLLTGTWCDARTDLAETLATYDPVWMRIVPKLLHANPNARACPSFAGERQALREAAAAEAEVRQEREASRAKRMRICLASGLVALLGVVVALSMQVLATSSRLAVAEKLAAQPAFRDLFVVPAEAGEDETDEMPSQEQFRAALIDALVLAQPVLSDWREGKITVEKVRSEFSRMRERAAADDQDLFSGVSSSYNPLGENKALALLFKHAEGKLK